MKKNFMFVAAAFAVSTAMFAISCTEKEDNNGDINGGGDQSEYDGALAGTIKENTTLEAGKTYSLEGAYVVPADLTLTIEEGVTIVAQDGGAVDFIIVQQGGKIMAEGSASEPIVMTSNLEEHGAWGGVHICGRAETNLGGSENVSEVGESNYGGDDNTDNSGTLSYVRVEYAGYLYDEDKECNGFTFYGVGNGTTLNNLVAYKGSDDGYEWFGGCVNATNLISIDNQDDSFDWTYGFTGTIDGAYAEHMSDKCDHLVEGDSNKTNPGTTLPISHPTIKNAVLIGIDRPNTGKASDNRGLRIRRGSEITLNNVQVYGKSNSLDFQSAETKAYFTENAATALVDVTINGVIVDALENAPLEASIFDGLTVDYTMAMPAIPTWATGNWVGDLPVHSGSDSVNKEEIVSGTTLTGSVSSVVVLTKDSSYKLDGAYVVADGGVLIIEEGVSIEAQDDDTVDFIIVQQGGKIYAEGTADSPIVMTSNLEEHGAWGGVHICGRAKTNLGGSDNVSEVGASNYGGENDADNSGVLSYVRVDYAGYLYDEDKECNGFTFYGVGNGTTLNNLMAYKGSDDGYEWFGGCVNATNLISIDNQDDSFDWTYGFTGTIDGAYAKHLSDKCDHLVEGDSNKTNPGTTLPISHPTIKNAVLVGTDRPNEGKAADNRGLRIRRGSEITLNNVKVYGKTNSFDFQSVETKAYFTENAADALVDVTANGAIVDALDSEPLEASIFTGLTIDADMAEPAAPAWATADWAKFE